MLILLSALGCATVDTKAINDDGEEKTLLSDSARLYWQGVRWEDSELSSNFIELEDDRALFRSRMEDRLKEEKLVEATILRVRVMDVEGASIPLTGTWRTGTVLVRLEGYTLPAQIVVTEEREQSWYRTASGWWLDWEEDAEEHAP